MTAHIPKAELHCHIEGAAEPELVLRLARKYSLDMSGIIKDGRYVWSDFTSFLNCYDQASGVFREPEDYRLLAYDYYSRLADQNAIYGEVFASPDHAGLMGISYTELIGAIADGIEDAKADHGIEGRILVTCVRHLGPESAEQVAEQLAANPHPLVTGFGMAGDERAFEVADFANAFAIASDAGMGLTAHAGELRGPQSVRDVIDILGATRIGHGVRSVEDPLLLERLREEGIVLEVCAGSNVALNIYPGFDSHPLAEFLDAGIACTLNSDDPPYFYTSLAREYEIAQKHFGLHDHDLIACTRTALDAAFVDEKTRSRLLKQLADTA
ncbi:adenosine deaminase [Pseudahrensia aquimaris]|uniref:Adenine deaminase n=1 Tax=Pseudahrensia aquimaris TaxID=744461 RepID=A0ABW3FHY9_9HYPH